MRPPSNRPSLRLTLWIWVIQDTLTFVMVKCTGFLGAVWPFFPEMRNHAMDREPRSTTPMQCDADPKPKREATTLAWHLVLLRDHPILDCPSLWILNISCLVINLHCKSTGVSVILLSIGCSSLTERSDGVPRLLFSSFLGGHFLGGPYLGCRTAMR
jgi:hypothetical protein